MHSSNIRDQGSPFRDQQYDPVNENGENKNHGNLGVSSTIPSLQIPEDDILLPVKLLSVKLRDNSILVGKLGRFLSDNFSFSLFFARELMCWRSLPKASPR